MANRYGLSWGSRGGATPGICLKPRRASTAAVAPPREPSATEPSAPADPPLQVGQRQLEDHRPAVGAAGLEVDGVEAVEQRPGLLAPRAPGWPAPRRGRPWWRRGRGAPRRPRCPAPAARAAGRGRRAGRPGPPRPGGPGPPSARRRRRRRARPRGRGGPARRGAPPARGPPAGASVTTCGTRNGCTGSGAACDGLAQPVEEHPLVAGVLVDDHQRAAGRLAEQVGAGVLADVAERAEVAGRARRLPGDAGAERERQDRPRREPG